MRKAGRGRSNLRDFIGLAGEIPRGPLAAADRAESYISVPDTLDYDRAYFRPER